MARTLAISVAGLVMSVVACVFIETAVIDWLNALPGANHTPEWTVWAVNTIPAFLTGFLVFVGLTYTLPSRDRQGQWRSHAIRVSPLYICDALLLAFIVAEWHVPDFGLVGQIFEWPFVALLGGILADLLVTANHRRKATRNVGTSSTATQ
jgi:hypothetical protein